MESQSVENGHLTKIIEKNTKNVEPPEMIVFKNQNMMKN